MSIVHGEQRLSRGMPRGLPADHPTFAAEADEVVPRVAVAELPRGRALGPYRAIITASGSLVAELSPYFGITGPLQHPVFLDPFPPAPLTVDGAVGVLAARGDVSYYHFLIDVLPRLAILERGGRVTAPDRLYMPATLSFQRELIAMMSISDERIIDSDQVRHLQAELLVVPGLPDTHLRTPPWVISFLRERLLLRSSQRVAGRRIYVTRGTTRGSRIVTNEHEVVEALGDRGFTVIEPGSLSVSAQIRTFAEAEWIVGAHGGALTNLTFASAGASVIELFAPDYVQGCYWKLSDCVPGLTYRYLVGQGKQPRAGRMWGVDSDITVDIAALVRVLDSLPVDSNEQVSLSGQPRQ
jgi:capsular polysaccharide biosynthesis protein